MADAKDAIGFVLKQDDSTLSRKITADAGGLKRFGVAGDFHPELTATGFFDVMPTAEALSTAEGVYQSAYWIPFLARWPHRTSLIVS
jgi:hypothetical protein